MRIDLTFATIFLLSLSCIVPIDAQNILTNQEREVALFFPFSLSTFLLPKKYTVSYYAGNPKKLKEKDLFYFNPSLYLNRSEEEIKNKMPFFASARFYSHETVLDTIEIDKSISAEAYIKELGFPAKMFLDDQRVQMRKLKQSWVNQYFQPFYFKKWEVTNAEYRAFVNAVIESKAHLLLEHVKADGSPDLKQKINWSDPRLQVLYAGSDHKVNIKRLEYEYELDGKKKKVNIYPDTACWSTDWPYSFNRPMTENYFCGKQFEDFPVVGINYYQAQAFCHWKTQLLNQQYPEGPALKVELPSEIEWEWISTLVDKAGRFNAYLLDEEWITDLQVDDRNRGEQDARLLSRRSTFERFYIADGFLYTSPANLKAKAPGIERLRKQQKQEALKMLFSNLDLEAISGMGNNVSEWMQETYWQHWRPLFNEELARLEGFASKKPALTIQTMRHFDGYCDEDGQLVRGANWADERYGMFGGKNRAGFQAKTFVSPERAHSTIGFRYVVRFEE